MDELIIQQINEVQNAHEKIIETPREVLKKMVKEILEEIQSENLQQYMYINNYLKTNTVVDNDNLLKKNVNNKIETIVNTNVVVDNNVKKNDVKKVISKNNKLMSYYFTKKK